LTGTPEIPRHAVAFRKYVARVRLVEDTYGFLIPVGPDGQSGKIPLAAMVAHVGLSTNASRITDTVFLKLIFSYRMQQAKKEIL